MKTKEDIIQEACYGIFKHDGVEREWILNAMQLYSDQQNKELREQIDKLANFIMSDVEGEPSQSEGAIDCAIRIIQRLTTGRSGKIQRINHLNHKP